MTTNDTNDRSEAIERNAPMELLGQIMTANARDLEHTTNLLMDGLRRDVTELRRLVADMDEIFQHATVVDRATEYRWRMNVGARIELNYDALEREGEVR